MPVCQAIQHAHQKGIIHRDIKPSNVLIALYDDKPVPKVIDFGIAKATGGTLTEQTIETHFGGVVGTPQYMSPEQASLNNLDIDTRSDVYSLGVLLYELLAGAPPFAKADLEKRGLLEMLRVVREEEPPRPSTKLSTADALPSLSANRGTEPKKLTGLLRNELDWIVMKALEKDRSRRYETANGFAADINRYLAGEAVQAHPPSMVYRLTKFVRRNKGQVIAASLVLLALLAGMVGTTWGLIEARRQERESKRQEQIAREETAEKEKARLAETERVTERDAAVKAEGERAHELKHRLGISAMVLANAAYDNRDFKLAAERLENVPVEQRGWEWRYLKRQVRGGIFTLHGHRSAVSSVAFSPDGTRIVTGGGDQHAPFEAKVWDARTGMLLFELKGLPTSLQGVNTPLVCVAFSADSKRIVTAGGGDKTARVYDAMTGALQLELTDSAAGDGVQCAAFSPDGTRIVTGGWNATMVWDASTGKAVGELKGQRHAVTKVSYSADGTRILTGGHDQAVRVWDARTEKLLLEAKGMMSEESSVAFSPDGKRIVAGREDGSARVIDAEKGTVLLELKGRPRVANAFFTSSGVLCVAFSPDGARIVTGGTTGGFGTGEASVWDARTGAELLELKGHTGFVMSVAFSPDGERIITGSLDGTAKVWDARTGTPRLELEGIISPVACAAFSPDGTWMVTGGGNPNAAGPHATGEATVWDARTGMPKFALKGSKGTVHSVAVSKDGTRIATGGGEFQKPGEATVWDARTGQALFELKGFKDVVASLAFSSDGTRIITGEDNDSEHGRGNGVKVWDAQKGTLLLDLTQPANGAFRMGARVSVPFSPDGKRVVVAGARSMTGSGEEVTVRDAQTGAVLLELKAPNDTPVCVAFSPDGARIAVGHSNNTATVWDAQKGIRLLDLKGHTGNVNSVAFSPDGKRIVTGSGDRTARVWDARTGTTLAELRSHTGAVTSVSFSTDGTRLLTAGGVHGKPGEVFVWDAPTRTQEVELMGHAGFIQAAAFSPDSTRIATASQDETVRVWDTRTGSTLLELKGFKRGVDGLAFNADGTRIATGGNGPKVTLWDAGTGTQLVELKTGPHKSLAFAIDGTRIVTEGYDKVTKVWNAETGKELPGEPTPKTVPSKRTSPDGRFLAYVIQNRVEVVPLVPDEEEIANRRLHTLPNPSRYRAGYLVARAAKDDFAAAFYINLVPPDERKDVLAQAEADAFAALTKLAVEYQRIGKREEAIPLLIEILNINKAKRGHEDPATIQTADTLGRIYHQTGQFEKAIPLLEDVLKQRKAKPDPTDRQALNAMGMLGLAYKDAGRIKDAIAVLEAGAAKDGWVRQHLLDVYALAGEHSKIVELSLKQLEIVRKAKDEGEATYTRADLLTRLGRACLAQKKWSEAEPHLRECLTLREKILPDDWNTFDVQSMLGGSLLGQKKYADAEPLLLKGYEGMKQRERMLEPPDALRVPEALDRLIELYIATNKPDEVKKWQAERAKYPAAPKQTEKK